MLLFPKYVL